MSSYSSSSEPISNSSLISITLDKSSVGTDSGVGRGRDVAGGLDVDVGFDGSLDSETPAGFDDCADLGACEGLAAVVSLVALEFVAGLDFRACVASFVLLFSLAVVLFFFLFCFLVSAPTVAALFVAVTYRTAST